MTFLKKFIPQILLELLRRRYFSGIYADWRLASAHSTGYDSENILTSVEVSALKVKHGEAVFERDSIIFQEKEFTWPVVASLLQIALKNNNRLHVLDFGGSLGSIYFQNRTFFEGIKEFSWGIIEQKNYVLSGKKHFEDSVLKFYFSVDEYLKHQIPSVALFSSVLQYLEDPRLFLDKFFDYKVEYILIDRTPFQENQTSDILTVQRVPQKIYKASYPCYFFNKKSFYEVFLKKYELVVEFNSIDQPLFFRGSKIKYGGSLFRLRQNSKLEKAS